MPNEENQDLESEIRGIARAEAEKAQKEVVFPEVQKVEVTNFPEQKDTVVEVKVPEIKVPQAVVNVPKPEVTVNVEKQDLTEISESLRSLAEKFENIANLDFPEFDYERFEEIAKRNRSAGGAIGPSKQFFMDSSGIAVNPATKERQGVARDFSSDYEAHVSHFGVLKTGPTIPVLKANFPGSSLNTDLWTETTANSGSVTLGDGMGRLRTSTNTSGSAAVRSVHQGRFEAGQVTVFQSGVRVGESSASNTKIWGLQSADGQEGLYFKMDGTTFQVVALKEGTETTVDSSNFNGETTFTPADTNNTYRIEYSAGRALFYRASGGKKILLHSLVNTAEPLVNDLDLGLYYENTNSGSSTDSSMYIRGASSSVWGSLDRYNKAGAHLTADFLTEVALGNVTKHTIDTKFGRNSDIDSSDTPEDIWEGGGTYTGQPDNFTPELVTAVSSSTADTSSGTGARTIRIVGLKSSTSTEYETEDITLNGTSLVDSANTWWRINRVYVLTAGSGGENAGVITIASKVATANVFAAIPVSTNQSQILAITVPASTTMIVKRMRLAITRASGGAGSANITMRARETGGVYRAVRNFELQTGAPVEFSSLGGIVLSAGTDLKFMVESVSEANNTIAEGAFEYLIIDD